MPQTITVQTTNEVEEFTVFGKVLSSDMDRKKVIRLLRGIICVTVDAPRVNPVGFAYVSAKRGAIQASREEYIFSYQNGVLEHVEYSKMIHESPYKSPRQLERERNWI